MARVDCLANFLTDVADAIRDKSKMTDPIPAKEFDKFMKRMVMKPEDNNFVNWQTWMRHGVISSYKATTSGKKTCIIDENSLTMTSGSNR